MTDSDDLQNDANSDGGATEETVDAVEEPVAEESALASGASSAPEPAAAPKAKPSRSPVEKWFVRGVIVALAALLGLELFSKKGFETSRDRIQAVLNDDAKKAFPLEELEGMLMGAPASQTQPEPGGTRVIIYRWRSVYQRYMLAILVDQDDNVFALEEADDFVDG